jgi:hypothetical protein
MPKKAGALIAGSSGALVSWLTLGVLGPAAVALPVNWAADKLADAAVGWFKRFRKTDDLSRMLKTATGTSTELSGAEFKDLRKLLEKQETWRLLAGGTVKDLADQIAAYLPARVGRTTEDSREAAETIARGLLEFAVFRLEPGNFQQVVLARLQRMTDQASQLDKALYELHTDLYALHARLDDAADLLKSLLDRLPPGPAERAEIVVYLTTLVNWLNTDPWPEDRQLHGPALTPAAIERKLRITAASGAGEGDLDADALARQCQRLVILGGSGSGKTWLAKRTARRRAEDTLEDLAAGKTLDEVELPLYTTCAHLFSAAAAEDNDIREAAVSSALSHIGDLGGSRITAALRLFFSNRNAPTVLIIDSLDEARGSDAPLRRADTLPWRIILTSRPNSWNQQLRIERENDSHRVGKLQPLRYPDDIERFIQSWFDSQPKLSKRLAAQIAERPDLQQAATVPLILAFYCIISGDKPLPDRRTALYTLVVRRMLTGRWRGSHVGNRQPHPDACLPVLRDWAWSGASDHNPVSGVGMWADDIPTDRVQLGDADAEALDHVATPVEDENIDTGKTSRRFVHRSIREQFVAEKVAARSADDAVEALLPHLWYDPDWEYAAPAALAMHPKRDQVLRELMCRAARSDQVPADLSVIDAGWELRGFLAQVASESSEEDWSAEAAAMIGQARVELALSARADDLGGGAHWKTSNHQACVALLELLDTRIGQWATRLLVAGAMSNFIYGRTSGLVYRADPGLVDGVVKLAASADDKQQARQTLLRLLDTETNSRTAAHLARGVVDLEPAPEDKRQATDALLRLLARQISSWPAGSGTQASDALVLGMVDGVVQLATSAEDRERACTALLKLLDSRPFWAATALVIGVVRLATSAEDKRRIRAALLRLLDTPNSDRVADALLRGVAQLDPTQDDKQRAREILLTLLDTPAFWAASSVWTEPLVGWVAELDPAPEDKQRVRELMLRLLDTQRDSSVAASLVDGVALLDPTQKDKQRARAALLRLLDTPNGDWVDDALVGWVAQLDPTPEDKQRARAALLTLLDTQRDSSVAASLVDGVALLDPTQKDKQRARAALLRLLDTPNGDWVDPSLVRGVAQLDPTPDDKQRARAALLTLLDTPAFWAASGVRAGPLVYWVAELDPTPEGKRQAREMLLRLLDTPNSDWAADALVRGVAQLDPTPEDKQRAREVLLTLLDAQRESSVGASLVDRVAELDPTIGDKQRARAALLRLLASETDSSAAAALVDRMAQLDPAVADLSTWRAWAATPTARLLAAARRNSPLADWLAALPQLTQPPG